MLHGGIRSSLNWIAPSRNFNGISRESATKTTLRASRIHRANPSASILSRCYICHAVSRELGEMELNFVAKQTNRSLANNVVVLCLEYLWTISHSIPCRFRLRCETVPRNRNRDLSRVNITFPTKTRVFLLLTVERDSLEINISSFLNGTILKYSITFDVQWYSKIVLFFSHGEFHARPWFFMTGPTRICHYTIDIMLKYYLRQITMFNRFILRYFTFMKLKTAISSPRENYATKWEKRQETPERIGQWFQM